jgi:hypothetical protein
MSLEILSADDTERKFLTKMEVKVLIKPKMTLVEKTTGVLGDESDEGKEHKKWNKGNN